MREITYTKKNFEKKRQAAQLTLTLALKIKEAHIKISRWVDLFLLTLLCSDLSKFKIGKELKLMEEYLYKSPLRFYPININFFRYGI